MALRTATAACVLAAALALVAPIPAAATHGAVLEAQWDDEVAPGDPLWISGEGWLPRMTCKNRVRFTVIDSGGRRHGAGKLAPPRHSRLVADLYGAIRVPFGVRAGMARVKAVQLAQFKVPYLGCLAFARKQSSFRIRIRGEEGNDPPEVTSLATPPVRQTRPTSFSWTVSEPGRTHVALEYLMTPSRILEIGAILDEDRPAGTNALSFDATVGGRVLPPGRYRITVQHTDAAGAKSALARRELEVVYGP